MREREREREWEGRERGEGEGAKGERDMSQMRSKPCNGAEVVVRNCCYLMGFEGFIFVQQTLLHFSQRKTIYLRQI
jgi:hypothetical protein